MSEDKSVHDPISGEDPNGGVESVADVIYLDGRRVAADPESAANILAARFREIAERREEYKAEHGHYPPPSPWVRWKMTQRRFAPALGILREAGFPDAWDRASDIAESTDTPEQAAELARHIADARKEGNDE